MKFGVDQHVLALQDTLKSMECVPRMLQLLFQFKTPPQLPQLSQPQLFQLQLSQHQLQPQLLQLLVEPIPSIMVLEFVFAVKDITSLETSALLEALVEPIVIKKLMELAFAQLDILTTVVFAQNVLKAPFGAHLQANAFMFVVKMQSTLQLLELVFVSLDTVFLTEFVKLVLLDISFQMDIALLAQSILHTIVLQEIATVFLDSILINSESVLKNVEPTKSMTALPKTADALLVSVKLMELVLFALQDQLPALMDLDAQPANLMKL